MQFAAGDRQGSSTARTEGNSHSIERFLRNGNQKSRPKSSPGHTRLYSERPSSGVSNGYPSIRSYIREGQAQYNARLNGARKSRIDKFQARFTFTHKDPKYYSDLPAQPATGWWKSLISYRRQSPSFVDRLCKNLDVLLPDTIYATSTECYYITNNPLALDSNSIRAQHLAFPEVALNGWLIKEDFTVSKLFERNAALYLASAGFPSGHMRRKASVRLLRNDPGHGKESAMVVPAAVMKQPHYAAANKNISKALDLLSTSALLADSSSERLVQIFVHGKKWARCQLTRAAWRAGNTPIGFTFINKLTPQEAHQANLDVTGQFCVSSDNVPPAVKPANIEDDFLRQDEETTSTKQGFPVSSSTFDVFALSGASLAEASEIARKLLLLTQTLFKVWLDTLVVDLAKGWNGKWYFLQVKSFTLKQSGARVDRALLADDSGKSLEEDSADEDANACAALRKQQAPLTQASICAMCGLKRSKKTLNRMMNHRMMLEAQHHMRKRGVDILFFHKTRKQHLSAESAVCGTCYSLYLAEKELIQLETELARETGQQISSSAGKLCFVTGILDAIQVRFKGSCKTFEAVRSIDINMIGGINPRSQALEHDIKQVMNCIIRVCEQGSFLMKDPDLLELLQAFENSCQPADKLGSETQRAGEPYGELEAQTNEDNVLATVDRLESSDASEYLMERLASDTPHTKTVQGTLITFRGGEAIQSGPSPLPYDIVLPAALHQWRLMLFLDSLQDPPPDNQKPYLLQLGIFGQISPVVLPLQDENGIVRIRRMLIFYLFSKKPTVTEVFKEELHFSLRSGDSTEPPRQPKRGRAQSAGPGRPSSHNGLPGGYFDSSSEASGQAVAVGSCSLGRLAGKRSVKNQTYVLLFEGDNGRCRLRISLGLHRDMQVPSQYVSVVPFRDAFVSRTPYCCSCPLPAEWLDCFLAPSD